MKRDRSVTTNLARPSLGPIVVLKSAEQRATATPLPRTDDTRVLWQMDLAKRYDVNRVTIYRWERANRLPPPDVIIGRHRGRYETTMLAFERAAYG